MTEPTRVALSAAQQEIMDLVWEHNELSVSEVQAILGKQREIARNTVLTLMTRMYEKGWLKFRLEGRTRIYCAAITKEATGGQKVKELIEGVFGGSPEQLMNALLEYRGLDKKEAERIRKMIDQAERRRKS